MAYPIRHKLLTVAGSSWNGTEEWSFSVRIIPDSGGESVSQTQCDDAAATVTTFWNTTGLGMPSNYVLEQTKLAPIGTDGHYPEGEIAFVHNHSGDTGPASSVFHAPQIAYAVTLLTAVPRGRGSRGRFYLPAPSFAVSSTTGKLSSGVASGIGGIVKDWLNALNGVTGLGTVGLITKVGLFGTSHAVTAVKTGVVLDTQRRRRNHLSEDYVTTAL